MPANFEFKAKCKTSEDLAKMREKLIEHGAEPIYSKDQDDTVFQMPGTKPGLKLRVQSPGACQLICWYRVQERGPKVCEYSVAAVSDLEATREILSEAIGVYGRVVKHREGLSYKDVIARLDSVQGLGEFIECEAPLEKMSEDRAREILNEILQLLNISSDMLIDRSYVDLVRELDTPTTDGRRMFYVFFGDEAAGGYGYWLDHSKTVWDRTEGEKYIMEIEHGSFQIEKTALATRILEEACTLRPESAILAKLEEIRKL